MTDRPTITTTAGAPVPDNQNSLTQGRVAGIMLQDYQLIEKLAHQNRERIPERVVHAKGWGAFWHAENHRRHLAIYEGEVSPARRRNADAGPLLDRRRRTGRRRPRARRPAVSRLILHRGRQLGPPATIRPSSSFAIPTSSPTSSTRRSVIRRPNLRSATAMWDYWSLVAGKPASGDDPDVRPRLPQTPMHMNGYGSHTYSFWNDAGERYWVKSTSRPSRATSSSTNEEGETVIGKTREGYQEALFYAIENGLSRAGRFRCRSCRSSTWRRRPTTRST